MHRPRLANKNGVKGASQGFSGSTIGTHTLRFAESAKNAVAGVRAQSLIVNLPGSPQGAVESLDAIADLLPHSCEVIRGLHHG